jgi:hypothetical protein
MDLLMSDEVEELLFGGAKGGGKSILGCIWVFTHARELVAKYHLPPSRYPIPIGWMGRHRRTDFVHTTLETWKQFIPEQHYKIREMSGDIILWDRCRIDFGGLDSPEVVQKFNSAEYCFAFIDQAEETQKDDVAVLIGSLRRRLATQEVPRKLLMTANPARCWLKDDFVTNPKPFQRYLQSLPTDNPWLPKTYIDQLRHAFEHRPELLEAYLYGSWDAFDAENQVIRESWIRDASGRQFYRPNAPEIIACDPARFGDDETVIYRLKDTEIVGAEIYGHQDTMHTANKLFVTQRDCNGALLVVDEGGLGAGIVDRLREMGADVLAVDSSQRAAQYDRYHNLRAEMWDRAGRAFSEREIALHWDDPKLVSELCSATYSFRNGRMLVSKKEEIKAIIRRSPNRADAYILGLHGRAFLMNDMEHTQSRGTTLHRGDGYFRNQHIIPNTYRQRRAIYDHERSEAKRSNW